MASAVLTALKKASKGLLFVSEKDAPWHAFAWKDVPELTAARLRERTGQPADAAVEERSLEPFFAALVKQEKWHGDEEKAQGRKYQELRRALEEHLSGLKVYRIGGSKPTFCIVGKASDGSWAGVRTEALET